MISLLKRNKRNFFALAYISGLAAILVASSSHSAFAAATVGDAIDNTSTLFPEFSKLVSAISYVLGALFTGIGVYKARDWSNSPQQTKASEIIKFLGAGGLLVAAPAAASVLANSIGMTSSVDAMGNTHNAGIGPFAGDVFHATGGSGLDQAIVDLVSNIAQPMSNIVMGFAYFAGAVLTVVGIVRLTKSAQEGPRGPSGLGTMATFVTAAMLLSASQVLGAFTVTIFGGAPEMFVYAEIFGLPGVPTDQAENVIRAILGFMAIVGMISFVRGIFVLRGFAEGNSQMTLMGGLSHIIAGVLAVNLGQFINMVESTLGVSLGSTTSFNIQFG
jgi:hypothetical protein